MPTPFTVRPPSGSRLRRRLCALTLVALTAGCGLLPGDDGDAATDAGPEAAASDPAAAAGPATIDSASVASTGESGAGGPGAADPEGATAAGDGGAGAMADGVGGEQVAPPAIDSIAVRLDRLLANQESMQRRLDALEDAPAPADSAGRGQVLGEAGEQVRSFGVGIFWSIIVLVFFTAVIRGLVWLLDTLAERNARRRLFYKRVVPVVRIILWVFAAYLIVSVVFRIDAQGIFAAAAAIGVAIGFAAQDLLKNLFGGLILVFDQPFQVGDKISVGGTYGEVVSIGLRSTRIVTADDNLVSVPNAQVVDQQVSNANAGELNCQVVTDLYLPGWADEEKARRIAFDAAVSSKYVYLNKPIVTLVADVFKETFLTRVRVKAYVMDPRLEFLFQSDITERARAGFREAGLLRPEHFRTSLVSRSVPAADDRSGSAAEGDPPATSHPDSGQPTESTGEAAPDARGAAAHPDAGTETERGER